jgi:hypothetical protein
MTKERYLSTGGQLAAAHSFLAEMRGLACPVAPRAEELTVDPDAVYLSPSGRRCRVFEVHFTGRRAHLLYDHKDGTPCRTRFGDGFTLSRANWHLLRRVA